MTTGRHRLLGGLAMAGGLCYLAASIGFLVTGNETGMLSNLLSVLWTLGCLCGLVGIGMLGVLGRGLFGRIALAVALLAYALAALDGVLIMAGVYDGEASPLFAFSRLGTLVGIAAVVTRRWSGWRMFTPFETVTTRVPSGLNTAPITVQAQTGAGRWRG